MMLAEYEGHTEITKLLMDNGATSKVEDQIEFHSSCHCESNEYRYIANMTKENRNIHK